MCAATRNSRPQPASLSYALLQSGEIRSAKGKKSMLLRSTKTFAHSVQLLLFYVERTAHKGAGETLGTGVNRWNFSPSTPIYIKPKRHQSRNASRAATV